jgi:uncharacterized protein (TIGR02145 family)
MSLAGIQTLVSIASKGRFVGFITNRFYQGHIKWCGDTLIVNMDNEITDRNSIIPIKSLGLTTVDYSLELIKKILEENEGEIVDQNPESIMIGDQEWLKDNLNTDTFLNGDLIPCAITDQEWINARLRKQPAWCYYNNDPLNGRLYNWYAINDPRLIAPKGWHIPSYEEWCKLISVLDLIKDIDVKTRNTRLWYKSSAFTNDESLHAKNLLGYRESDGEFRSANFFEGWWSSTRLKSKSIGKYAYFFYSFSNLVTSSSDMGVGFSVRCVKDQTK